MNNISFIIEGRTVTVSCPSTRNQPLLMLGRNFSPNLIAHVLLLIIANMAFRGLRCKHRDIRAGCIWDEADGVLAQQIAADRAEHFQ
jgi:hypothetical protein